MASDTVGHENKRWLFGIAALGLSMLLTVAIAEFVVMLLIPQPASWLAVYREHPRLPFYAPNPGTRHRVATGETDWWIEVAEQGFRFDSDAHVGTKCAALWLGDSFGFGHGVDYSESIIGLVDRATPGMANVNTSAPGYGPVQYRQMLEDVLAQASSDRFDRVYIMTFLGNDFHDTQWDKNVPVVGGILGNEGGLDSFLKRNSHLRRLAANIYHLIAPAGPENHGAIADELANPKAWQSGFMQLAAERYRVEMAKIGDLAASRGLELAVLIMPTRYAVAAARGESAGIDFEPGRNPLFVVERARDILSGLGIRSFDATSILAEATIDEMFFRFDRHLTVLGNQRVAEAFLADIQPSCR